jgi:GGDEF domain-containing protein
MYRRIHPEDVIMRFDREHRHLYVNPAIERLIGFSPEEFVGKTHQEMGFPQDLVQLWDDAIEKVFTTAKPLQIEFQLPEGTWMDWLLMPELDTPEALPLAVIMADSNGLKLVNDTYGHAVGDEMLRAIGEILQEVCADRGVLARWGGDEFVIVLPRTTLAEDVLSHHERWDGTGYPRGLKERSIPLLARITSVVDAYDVMTHGRPYKAPLSQAEALEECRRCSGTQFDPDLVKVFLEMMGLRSDV